MLLAQLLFISALVLHLGDKHVAFVDPDFESLLELVDDLVFAVVDCESFLDLGSAVNLIINHPGLLVLQFFKSLVSTDFSLSLSLCLPLLQLAVQFLVLLIDLSFEFLVDLLLSLLVLRKDVLEVLGPSSVSQSVLVVSQPFHLDLLEFEFQLLSSVLVLLLDLFEFSLQFFVQLLHNLVLLVGLLELVLVELLVNVSQLVVQLASSLASLLELAFKHLCLAVFVIKK